MDWTDVLAAEDENRRARLAAKLLASATYGSTAKRAKAFVDRGEDAGRRSLTTAASSGAGAEAVMGLNSQFYASHIGARARGSNGIFFGIFLPPPALPPDRLLGSSRGQGGFRHGQEERPQTRNRANGPQETDLVAKDLQRLEKTALS